MWPESIANEVRLRRISAIAHDNFRTAEAAQRVEARASTFIQLLQEVVDTQIGINTDSLRVDTYYDGEAIQETTAMFALQPDMTTQRELEILGEAMSMSELRRADVRARDHKIGITLGISEELHGDGKSTLLNVGLVTSLYYTDVESLRPVYVMSPRLEILFPDKQFKTLHFSGAGVVQPGLTDDPTHSLSSLDAGLDFCKMWLEAPGARRAI